MKKYCIGCGKEVAPSDMPLELALDNVLCRECAGDIIDDMNQIYRNMPEAEFHRLRKKIIEKSKQCFIVEITDIIIATTDSKYYGVVDKRLLVNYRDLQKASGEKVSEDYEDCDGGMFGNIGGKIKGLAQFLTWIGIIGSVIMGVTLMAEGDFLAIIGLIVAIVGSLLSWLSSFLLYGFGQLVQNSDKTVALLKKLNK